MIQRHSHRARRIRRSFKANWAAALAAMLLPGSLLAAQAALASPILSGARPFTQTQDGHVIKLDNSKGTRSLQFHEDLRQRQCVATVTPDSLRLAPGETAEVRLDVRDSPQSGGCRGDVKHVLWNITAVETGSRMRAYKLLFSDDPKTDGQGERRIASTVINQPGAPYAATCGDHECLDEWVPRSGTESTIFFYRRD